MEALGVASGILTALSATADLASLVQSIKNAPIELIALSNEVADLKLVISEVEALDRNCNLVRKSSESLTKILLSARITFDHFAHFIDNILQSHEDGKKLASRAATQRFRWAISQKKTAKRLQRELRAIRLNIGILLAAQSRWVKFAVWRVLNAHIFSADSHSVYLILNRDSVQSKDSKPDAKPNSAANVADGQSLKFSTSSNMTVSLHKRHHIPCLSNCRCQCQSKVCRQILTFLTEILGKLLIEYSGTLTAMDECSNTCRNDVVFNAQVTYVFPYWFVEKAISMAIRRTQRSLTVFVAVRNYTQEWKLVHYILSGDLSGVKFMVQRKRVSPNDLDTCYGRTALHVRSL